MPAERFYVNADLSGIVTIEGPEHHHLAHVMRVRIGDEIEVVNGRGAIAEAKVTAISKQTASLTILSASQTPLPPTRLILAIPLMRPSKLELVIEKCTELGADAFWLYPAHYSEKDDLSPHQQERLNIIAISAMKQCGRLDLPPIRILAHFEEIFYSEAPCFFGDTRNAAKIKLPEGELVFITGPERGFFEKELKLLDQKATGVRLHRNILRAETAPIAAAALFS